MATSRNLRFLIPAHLPPSARRHPNLKASDFTANRIEVVVHYDQGGMNYANYKNEPRGYYLTVSAAKVDEPVTGLVSMQLAPLDPRNARFHLQHAVRFNAARLKELYTRVKARAGDILKAMEADSPTWLAAVVQDLVPVATVRGTSETDSPSI